MQFSSAPLLPGMTSRIKYIHLGRDLKDCNVNSHHYIISFRITTKYKIKHLWTEFSDVCFVKIGITTNNSNSYKISMIQYLII